MSEENVEAVRRCYEAANRGDWDAAFRDAHPNFEMTVQRGPYAGTHCGREAVQRMLVDIRTPFDVWDIEPEQLLDNGDQVVALIKNRVRPKGTSAELETRNGHVWRFRDGKAVSLDNFPASEDSLKAAGLS
jgi:uncharacterized protein